MSTDVDGKSALSAGLGPWHDMRDGQPDNGTLLAAMRRSAQELEWLKK
jgi:hypothetical protein